MSSLCVERLVRKATFACFATKLRTYLPLFLDIFCLHLSYVLCTADSRLACGVCELVRLQFLDPFLTVRPSTLCYVTASITLAAHGL